MQNKIFGIGLPKTGTMSLNTALKKLGFKSIHYPREYKRQIWRKGNYKWEKSFDAMTNFGEWFFPQLDETYPDSKFILTIREKESWLQSIEKHFANFPNTATGRVEIFGTKVFHRDRFSYVYDFHKKTVKEYFKGREQDLLIYDLCGGEEWKNLCDFLDIEIPDESFPCKNNRIDKDIKKLEKQLKELRKEKGD